MDIVGTASIYEILLERAELNPDRDFVIFQPDQGDSRSVTYSQFLRETERCAVAFERMGLKPGDAVVLHLGPSLEFLTCWFALARLGVLSVPTNLASAPPELAHAINISGARQVVTEPTYAERFDRAASESGAEFETLVIARGPHGEGDAPSLTEILGDISETDHPEVPMPRAADVAEILFTSGTTALPKGALITHANLVRSGERVSKHYSLTADDRPMALLPLFHVGGQSMGIMCTLVVGATCVLVEKFSASSFLRQVRDHKVSFVMLVPTHVRTLLAQPPTNQDRSHSLRSTAFGLKITDDERDQFEDRFRVRLTYCYGQTEAMLLIAIAPLYGPRRWPSVGLPAFDRVVKLIDDEGKEPPIGSIGEIVVSADPGRTVMKGYANDPDATAAVLRDGWLYTGDYGWFDERGYLFFADRKKDMIKRAGENVSALEVETVLTAHPWIDDAAVIGVPDPLRDEAVKAFVVLTPGKTLTSGEIVEHCKKYLSPFKIPTMIEFRDSLPKTSIGKTIKQELRA